MYLLNKTFYSVDYKNCGKVKKWGKVIDLINDEAIVYLSSNPIGAKIFHIKLSDIDAWLHDNNIFLKGIR